MFFFSLFFFLKTGYLHLHFLHLSHSLADSIIDITVLFTDKYMLYLNYDYYFLLLTISNCGRAHCGPVCGFFMCCLQIAGELFGLCHHSVYDFMCFTVMFHR